MMSKQYGYPFLRPFKTRARSLQKPPKVVAFAAVLSISSCGGGGGGSVDTAPPAVPFNGFASVPINGAYLMDGKLTSRNLTIGSTSSSMGAGTLDDNVVATAQITNQGGDVVRIKIDGGTIGVDVDDTPIVAGGFLTMQNTNTTIVAANPPTFGNEYSAFGIGFTSVGGGAVFGGAFGVETPSSGLPTGAASYSGESVGLFVDTSGNTYLTGSDIAVTTSDFSTFSINSTNTQRANLTGGSAVFDNNLDFSANATLSGSSLAGIFSGSGVGGNIDAQVFGPNGEEIGGNFTGTGTSGDYLGAFGSR